MMLTPPSWRAPALVVAAALSSLGVSLAADAAPCDTLDAAATASADGYLPPPFSADELREALLPGLEVLVRAESPVAGQFSRLLRVVAAAPDRVTLEETVLEPQARAAPAAAQRLTWEQLRDRACLPAASTTRERVTTGTPWGDLAGWRYRYRQEEDEVEIVLTFADELPGPPVATQRYQGEILLMAQRQTQRSDRPGAAGDETAPGPAESPLNPN